MKLTATCMFDALKIEPYIVMYFFLLYFLKTVVSLPLGFHHTVG